MTISPSKFVIDHGVVPAPAKRGIVGKYPFRELTDVGDAMFIPEDDIGPGNTKLRNIGTLRSLCSYWAKPARWQDRKEREFRVRYIKHRTGRYGYQVSRTK